MTEDEIIAHLKRCSIRWEVVEAVKKLAANVERLRDAGRVLLMVSLPPHDVSGQAIWEGAAGVFKAAEAAKEKP